MKRKISEEEYKLICKELKELGLVSILSMFKRENSYINGVTFLRASDSPYGRVITYAEDDLKDEYGNPYIFEDSYYGIYGEMEPGRRMIAIYAGDTYSLIPVNGETFMIVGAVNTDEKLDIARSKKLPTPKVLELPKEQARPVTERDVAGLKKAVKTYGKLNAAKTVGTIALILLCVIIIGIIYIFIMAEMGDDLTPKVFVAVTAVAVLLLVAGIIGSIKFFKNIYLRNVLKMKYIKQVMIVKVEKAALQGDLSSVSFYEWVGDDIKFGSFSVGFGQLFLMEGCGYGDIAYMLTKEKDKSMDMFSTRIFVSKEMVEGNDGQDYYVNSRY